MIEENDLVPDQAVNCRKVAGHVSALSALGSKASRKPSPNRVVASTVIARAAVGKHCHMPVIKHEIRSGVDHLAPAGCRRRNADAEEAQAGFEHHGERHRKHEADDYRGDRVGDKVTPDDVPGRGPQSAWAARINSFSLTALHLGPHEKAHLHPAKERRDGDDCEEPAPGERAKQHGRQQRWHHRKELDHPHHRPNRPCHRSSRPSAPSGTPIAMEKAAAAKPIVERDAGAVDDAREEVAAKIVDAKPELRRREGQRLRQISLRLWDRLWSGMAPRSAARTMTASTRAPATAALIRHEAPPGEIERATLPRQMRFEPGFGAFGRACSLVRASPIRIRGLSHA